MKKRIAIVAGATGLVGGELVQELLIDPAWEKVYVLVRQPLEWSHPKLEQLHVDWDHLLSFPQGITDAFCCLGTTIGKAGSKENFRKVDYDYAVQFAVAAKKAGSESFFIVTALGADPNSMVFYSRVKGEVEVEIRKLGFSSLGIFRPSLLDGKRKEFRFGERIGQALAVLINPFLIGPVKKYRSIEGRTVAKALLNLAWSDKKGVFALDSDIIQLIGTSAARANLDSYIPSS